MGIPKFVGVMAVIMLIISLFIWVPAVYRVLKEKKPKHGVALEEAPIQKTSVELENTETFDQENELLPRDPCLWDRLCGQLIR
jgi:uncharacterized protein YpmB